jgi:hypothetical protein
MSGYGVDMRTRMNDYYDHHPHKFKERSKMPKKEKKYGSIIGIAIIGGLGIWLGKNFIIEPKPVDPVPVVIVEEVCICVDGHDPNCKVCAKHILQDHEE